MADDFFKLKSNDSSGYFAMALRAIGQDLAELFPQQIEVYYQNETFDVRVRCDRKRAERKTPAAAKSGLKNVIRVARGRSAAWVMSSSALASAFFNVSITV